MINPDHAKRVLEHQSETPVMILARHYSGTKYPSPLAIEKAKQACELLVLYGYAIEPIEDDDET